MAMSIVSATANMAAMISQSLLDIVFMLPMIDDFAAALQERI